MKKSVLHTATLMHSKARQVLRHLFRTKQGNSSKMTFLTGNNKVHMKKLKIQLRLDDMMQETFCRYQLYSD